MLEAGQVYSEAFVVSQEQVIQFAEVTGDRNPVHLDAEYAGTTQFKKPIIHGMFGAGIFSRILGMKFPGEGTIYLSQDLSFKRPMFPGTEYEAVLTVTEINTEKHIATIETKIIEKASQKPTITGQAQVMNKEKI